MPDSPLVLLEEPDPADTRLVDVAALIDAYCALRADHAALRAAVARALDSVGGLAQSCPELARAVGWKGGESCP